MTNAELTRIFLRATSDDRQLADAYALLREHHKGNFWLCGGYVFRTLAGALYGGVLPPPDVDMMSDTPVHFGRGIRPWRIIQKNHYGNPKLEHRSGMTMDLWNLRNHNWIRRRGHRPLLQNYLRATPLTIQSIVFDPLRKRIVGAAGIRALISRTVAIHNRGNIEDRSKRYGTSIASYITEKASSLGFKAAL